MNMKFAGIFHSRHEFRAENALDRHELDVDFGIGFVAPPPTRGNAR